MEQLHYAIHPQVAFREVEGEMFIVTPDNRFHNLVDPVSVSIWRACDGTPRTEADLTAMVVATFRVDEATARADLAAFLANAVKLHLLVAS
ncbi:MAG: hypothetical protein AMXMBFR64_48510 [Myxococcales bacterium]